MDDPAGEMYNPNRDFRLINLGYEYWELSSNYETCRTCFDDILSKRYELAGKPTFPGIEIMLGRADELEDIGLNIRKLKESKKLRTLRYHGAKVFIKLCSGDLSYLLDILGKMDLRAANEKYPIHISIQNEVIKNYARIELRSLQDIRPSHVKSLYEIAYWFGIVSKTKLVVLGKDYLKIEVEVEKLTPELRDTMRELLCYGIFIDGGFSNNSDGKLARKLFFRRIFTPAFPTTMIGRNTLSMRAKTFRNFVYAPADYARERMSADEINPKDQQEFEQLEAFE